MRTFNLRSFLFWAAKDNQKDIQHANFQLASLPFLGRQRQSETYTTCEFSNCILAPFGASKALQKRNNIRLFYLWSCHFWSCRRHSNQYKTCDFSNCILALFGPSTTLKSQTTCDTKVISVILSMQEPFSIERYTHAPMHNTCA